MANYSDFLNLSLPGFGEYRDSWWEPINNNFIQLDSWAQGIEQEILDARFTMGSLKGFLQVAHDQYGNLLPTPEVISSRSSPIFGFQTPAPEADFLLNQRLDQSDWEVWKAREGQADLRALTAFKNPSPRTQILDGHKTITGYPDWMEFAGPTVTAKGSLQPIWLLIDGRLARIRTDKELTITGGAGTKFIYANYLADGDAGKIIVNGDSVTPPGGDNAGAGMTSLDTNDHPIYFNDPNIGSFATEGVQAGDFLNVLDLADLGKYVVKEVGTNANPKQLSIIGLFPVGNQTPINYTISDPLAVSLSFEDTETAAVGKICIGEAVFDGGTSVTEVRPRHFRDVFISPWVAVNIDGTNGTPYDDSSSTPGYFQAKFPHKLGSTFLDIDIQVSQANDGSAPVERLVTTSLTADLDINISNDLVLVEDSALVFTKPTHAPDTFVPASSGATFTRGAFDQGSVVDSVNSIGGDVTGSLVITDLSIDNGVRAKWDRNYVWIKNVVGAKFYKDYDGTARKTGYLRVIVRKRG